MKFKKLRGHFRDQIISIRIEHDWTKQIRINCFRRQANLVPLRSNESSSNSAQEAPHSSIGIHLPISCKLWMYLSTCPYEGLFPERWGNIDSLLTVTTSSCYWLYYRRNTVHIKYYVVLEEKMTFSSAWIRYHFQIFKRLVCASTLLYSPTLWCWFFLYFKNWWHAKRSKTACIHMQTSWCNMAHLKFQTCIWANF